MSEITCFNGTKTSSQQRVVSSLLLPALLAFSLSTPAAQEVGDAGSGRRMATDWCSSCHIVSPTAERGSSNGAPAFAAIASMESTTPMALRVFLQTPHSRMSDLHLSLTEIDDLTAYILSLKHR